MLILLDTFFRFYLCLDTFSLVYRTKKASTNVGAFFVVRDESSDYILPLAKMWFVHLPKADVCLQGKGAGKCLALARIHPWKCLYYTSLGKAGAFFVVRDESSDYILPLAKMWFVLLFESKIFNLAFVDFFVFLCYN